MCSVNCFIRLFKKIEAKELKPRSFLVCVWGGGRSLQFLCGAEESAFWFRKQVCNLPF